jgi:hypothetical protein
MQGEIAKRTAAKGNGEKLPRLYYVLDEVDNTLLNVDKETAQTYAALIKTVAKESDHLNLGIIINAQNPNASNMPGFDRADFANFVNIHIGNVISDALANTNDTSGTSNLTSVYGDLTEFCTSFNAKIEDERLKMRFALVVSREGRKFIELPLLGEYGFDAAKAGNTYDFETFNSYRYPEQVRSLDDCTLVDTRTSLESILETPVTRVVTLDRVCPICRSTKLLNKGRGTGKNEGKTKYICQNTTHPKGIAKTFYH